MSLLDDHTVKELNKITFNTVARPIRSSSLFYSVYYLSEIENMEDASFDLFKLTNSIDKGMYYYSIGSISKEISKAVDRLIIKGNTIKQGFSEDPQAPLSSIRRFVSSNVGPQYQNMANKILIDVANQEFPLGRRGFRGFRDQMMDVEDKYNALSEPDVYVNACRGIFGVKPAKSKREELLGTDITSWSSGFGGDGWTGVCDHFLNREELPKRAWVDISWSVQHNTGNWLNKISINNDEFQVVFDVNRGTVIRRVNGGGFAEVNVDSTEEMRSGDVRRILTDDILDANAEGDMDRVFEYAVHYNDEVGVDLRRQRRLL